MYQPELLVWPVGERRELPSEPSHIVERMMTTKRIIKGPYGLWVRIK